MEITIHHAALETVIVEVPEKTDPFGAKGIGEGLVCAVVPAIATAIYDAVGIRFNKIPILPGEVVAALKNKKGIALCKTQPGCWILLIVR